VDALTPANPVLDYGRIKLETEKQLSQMAAEKTFTPTFTLPMRLPRLLPRPNKPIQLPFL
jgi:hypothetical protein